MSGNDNGIILIISGPSGGGKSTVVHTLLETTDDLMYSISATTRDIRDGEVDGRDYHFITVEEFEKRLAADDFLEHNHYTGSTAFYGTPKQFVVDAIEAGKTAVLEIDVNGARQVRAKYPGRTLTLFLMPPTIAELEARLRARPDNKITEERIQSRLRAARDEIRAIDEYDGVIFNYNGRQDEAVNDIKKALADYKAHRSMLLGYGADFLGKQQ